jgi:hypothetical protein
MVSIKRRIILITVSLSLILSLAIIVGAQEYWANYHTTSLIKLTSVSEFVPSHKTNSTDYGVKKGYYIKSAWVRISEAKDVRTAQSKSYPKSDSKIRSVSVSQPNNPFKGQTWVHGWAYN